MTDHILIGRNIRLTYKLTAKAIYVSPDGEITLVTKQFGPNAPIPELSVQYLESVCSRFYYGGFNHKNAIADIMLLNSVLRKKNYDGFYEALSENLKNHKYTVISFQYS